MLPVTLRKDYVTNVDEIMHHVRLHDNKFVSRKEGRFKFENKYGDSNMFSLFDTEMNNEMKEAIFRTMPKEDMRIKPTSVTINKYLPGSYLPKHRDCAGMYWKFQLVFLTSEKPHLMVYTEDGQGHLVEEIPGALCEMPIDILHEVTEIEKGEAPKYSMVMAWSMG